MTLPNQTRAIYFMATMTLYVPMFKLFTNLRQLLGFAGRDD